MPQSRQPHPKILLLYGNQSWLREQSAARYTKATLEENAPEWSHFRFDASEIVSGKVALDDLRIACLNPPFLCSRYLVQIDGMELARGGLRKGGGAAEALNRFLLEGLPKLPPGLHLLLTAHVEREQALSRPLLAAARKYGEARGQITYADWFPGDWLDEQAQVRGFLLPLAQARLFVELLGNNLTRLANELDKLALLTPAGEAPGEALLLRVARGRQGSMIFEINNRLAERDLKGALGMLDDLFALETHPGPQLIGVLAHNFRQMLVLRHLQDSATPRSEWASRIRLPPFLLRRVAAQGRRFRRAELEQALRQLAHLDVQVRRQAPISLALFQDFMRSLCASSSQEVAQVS